MELSISTVSLWSYGSAGVGYLAFASYLVAKNFKRHEGGFGSAMLVALILCGLWGLSGFLLALSGWPVLLFVHLLLDTLRYGAWYACLLILLAPEVVSGAAAPPRPGRASGSE